MNEEIAKKGKEDVKVTEVLRVHEFLINIGCNHGNCHECEYLKSDSGPCFQTRIRSIYKYAECALGNLMAKQETIGELLMVWSLLKKEGELKYWGDSLRDRLIQALDRLTELYGGRYVL